MSEVEEDRSKSVDDEGAVTGQIVPTDPRRADRIRDQGPRFDVWPGHASVQLEVVRAAVTVVALLAFIAVTVIVALAGFSAFEILALVALFTLAFVPLAGWKPWGGGRGGKPSI